MYRKLRHISKHNKLVQLVVKVKYHMNVIKASGADTHKHTHTDIVDKSNFLAPAFGRRAPGLKNIQFKKGE